MQCNGNVKGTKWFHTNCSPPLTTHGPICIGSHKIFCLYIKTAHTLKLQMVNSVFSEFLKFAIQTIG